jgi:hydrogenase maturation protein HypF
MATWHIHIEGQVQGVGFRPFVYKQAREFGVRGWVNNTIDGVHCSFNAGEKTARRFHQSLIKNAPELSDITSHHLQRNKAHSFDDFRIIHSNDKGKRNLLLTPDFAMCEDCRRELSDESNRRYNYPFITCTNCGPRYSIIESLPYDRETTTMQKFEMCAVCNDEYWNPLERRYYSQTNSCADCGLSQRLYDNEQNISASETTEIIQEIAEQWNAGKIVAVKGIGGYLLTCDAANKSALHSIRKRKKRPAKPFALMYPDAESIERDMVLRSAERKMLLNAVSPIVLLETKNRLHSLICLQQIAPGLTRLGVMIPYTPLYALLMDAFERPIVATSGNITHSPITFRDQEAIDELTHIADYVLVNNRRIVVPQDDSVVSFTPTKQQQIINRRSRGLAPSYINKDLDLPTTTILAAGAMLKSTFTYLHRQNMFISQYLGDLRHFDAGQNYRHTVEHFFDLFGDKPDLVLADKHPDYFSTRFAVQLADELNAGRKNYQHHLAHFAAVLGEHGLLNSQEPVLGVIWDGTGLGSDEQIWGGEFFIYDDGQFNRCSHLGYFDFILGDKMPREPRISALAAARSCTGSDEILRDKFTPAEWKNYITLLQNDPKLQTSSAGRLFDAIASLLNLKDVSDFEGQAAMLLEALALEYIHNHTDAILKGYPLDFQNQSIPLNPLLQAVIDDIRSGKPSGLIAAKFHYAMANLITQAVDKTNIRHIAFSGGVFQNALLTDMVLQQLNGRQLYFHKQLSPNDENISFGQLMCHLIAIKQNKLMK